MVINLIRNGAATMCIYNSHHSDHHRQAVIWWRWCGAGTLHKNNRSSSSFVFQLRSIVTHQTVDGLHFLKEEAMIIAGLTNGKSVSVAIVMLSVALIVSGPGVMANLQLAWDDNEFVNETLAINALVEYVSTIVCGFQSNVVFTYYDQDLQTTIAEQLITASMSSQCASLLIVR